MTGFNPRPDGWMYSGVDDFILQHGVEGGWSSLPDDISSGKKKECYLNATHLASDSERFIYVEGYAFNIIPCQHAWCIERTTNQVVDPTWTDHEDAIYPGVDRCLFR